MKDKKEIKLVPLPPALHHEVKVHAVNKQVKIADFVERAVRNQLKREQTKS